MAVSLRKATTFALMASALAIRAGAQPARVPAAAVAAANQPTPFLEQTAPPATFAAWRRVSAYVPMRDGTLLALTAYLPTGGNGVSGTGAAAGSVPALLWYHPGHRESIDIRTGEIRPVMPKADLEFFTSHGYAVVIAEMRGSGASFGSRELDRGPQIGRDGKDLVDWIARQPWCDGRLGMIGASYQGFAQYATAGQRPRALKAIFPEIAGFDDYGSMFYPGGILNAALSNSASNSIVRDDLNYFVPGEARARYPSVPVVDEDGDGQLADEIPVDRNGNGDFLDDGPPTYADGQPRKDIYYRATKAHVANRNLTVDKLAKAPHRDSEIDGSGYTYADIDPSTKPAAIAAAGIAVYNRGGWFDYHARDTAIWYATLAGHTPTRLMMAPTGHGGLPDPVADSHAETLYRAGPYFALFGDTRTTSAAMNREKLAFFDHYVKGLDNGFDRRPPVLLYVMGKGWRYEREWPLARARAQRLGFGPDGSLTADKALSGHDSYRVDLAATTAAAGANRWNYGISTARKPMTLDGQTGRRLSYATAPLASDMEVTGHPLISLVLSSDKAEGDVFAYLEDVAPDGTSLLVSEGELRANYTRLRPMDSVIRPKGALKVRPALPWQGFAKADYQAAPFAAGRQLALRFDLMPTAWVFRAGHRIRVSLAGADWPSFALHPRLSPANDPGAATTQAPVWTVYRGEGLSAITLPVVPER